MDNDDDVSACQGQGSYNGLCSKGTGCARCRRCSIRMQAWKSRQLIHPEKQGLRSGAQAICVGEHQSTNHQSATANIIVG